MTQRQKTIGVTGAIVVSVLTFTTYNPIDNRIVSSSSTGQGFQSKNIIKKQTPIPKDTLLYHKQPANKYAIGYNNPIEE